MNDAIKKYSWTTLEYEYTPRSRDWYIALIVIGLSLGITAIILHNILFGIFIILSAGMILYLGHRKPSEVSCTIDENNLTLHQEIIPLKKIKAFTFRGTSPHRKLLLSIDRTFIPFVTIPLEHDSHEQEIDAILSKKCTRDDALEEPFITQFAEKIKL
jgi:hypothetical protein